MALTIDKTPAVVSLASNPIRFEVTSDDYLLQPGEFHESWFKVTGAKANDIFSLQFQGVLYEFEVTDDPTPTAFKFPSVDAPTEDYEGLLLAFFNECYFIERYFTISTESTNGVRFKAKEGGEEFNIVYGFSGIGSLIIATITTGTTSTVKKDRFIRADIWIEDVYNSGNYFLFASIEKSFVNDGTIEFNLQKRMKAYFLKKNELANVGVENQARLDEINKRYYVSFSQYDAEFSDFATDKIDSSVLRVVKGAIKKDEYLVFPDIMEDWLKPEFKYLSWRANRREISEGGIDHLYFINHRTTDATVKSRIIFYYTNNTNEVYEDQTFTKVHDYETYCWNVSFDRVKALATIPAGESIKGYTCYFTTAAGVQLTESIHYKVVEKSVLSRIFIYENSFGVFETITTDSEHSFSIDIDQEESIRALPDNADYKDGEIIQTVFGFDELFSGSTGFKSKEEALSAVDFLISKQKYLRRGIKLIRIITTTSKFSPYKDDGYPYGFSFNYKKVYQNEGYSAMISIDFEESADSGTLPDAGLGEG